MMEIPELPMPLVVDAIVLVVTVLVLRRKPSTGSPKS